MLRWEKHLSLQVQEKHGQYSKTPTQKKKIKRRKEGGRERRKKEERKEGRKEKSKVKRAKSKGNGKIVGGHFTC
jgi:hypothetical protein